MPLDELHKRVASIALQAAAEHGFALGGGNALIAHGVIARPTQDVDLFTNRESGVRAASGAVEAALCEAGFTAENQDKTAGLADIFAGMGEGLAEWIVTAPGGEQMALQMAYFERAGQPVVMEVGPVLALEDVAGGKVCALASRAYERDFLDTAALLGRYTPEEMIGFARRLDPGLEGQDFAEAAQRLDRLPDEAFAPLGLRREDIETLRERFASWPREAEPRAEAEPGPALAAEPAAGGGTAGEHDVPGRAGLEQPNAGRGREAASPAARPSVEYEAKAAEPPLTSPAAAPQVEAETEADLEAGA
jgi:Nucleotidyl transferase AbiEii toxin, Type IV TA system